MYRYLVGIHFLLISALACPSSFMQCQDKFIEAKVEDNRSLIIPLSKTRSLLYSIRKPTMHYVKSDRLLGLYLINNQNNQYPYIFSLKPSKRLMAISATQLSSLESISGQLGLSHLGQYKDLKTLGLINDSCCTLHGIATTFGVIEKSYLEHFIESNASLYGDVGIRLENKKDKVVVVSVDPYFKDQAFKVGDELLYMDKKDLKSAQAYMEKILFLELNSEHYFRIKRDNRSLPIAVQCDQRYGGGLLSDTYLERFGIYLDSALKVTEANSRLHVEDKIVAINGAKILNLKNLREEVVKSPNNITLLVERHGFQFFLKLKESK